jgi:hypothetical protein
VQVRILIFIGGHNTLVGYYHVYSSVSGLYSSVPGIFLSFDIDEYSSVIFLGIEEYNKTEEDTLFFL